MPDTIPAAARLSRGTSVQAIRQHYDVGNDFYRLWLDPSCTYSCALWSDEDRDDMLEQAQVRKLDYHVRAARVQPGSRVLDVGCGWGGLLQRLVHVHGVAQATGLTLSKAQADWIAAMQQPGIEARLESWTDYAPAAPVDAIISIGAFEHFARPDWEDSDKVDAYRAFFARCHQLLKPGGWMSLQTIAYGNVDWQEVRDAPGRWFLLGDVFPESELPTMANILQATDGLFEIVALRNDRDDYRRTCQVWLNRLLARRAEAVALVGEELVARYLRYLKLSAVLFKHGQCYLLRITLQRFHNAR
jgi:cyclopropane-fatty-acyl-phospholipid synthase